MEPATARLIEDCLKAIESSGLDALEEYASRHPEREHELRVAVEHLRSLGLLELEDPASAELPRAFGNYTLQALLGRGAMGAVYAAIDQEGRPRAIKMVRPHLLANPSVRLRFERERRALQLLRCPSVVRLTDYGEVEGCPYLAMERMPGPSLHDWIRSPDRSSADHRPLLRKFRDLAQGLARLHEQGVLHRDLKPANILLDAEHRLVAIDFGLAMVEHSLSLTSTGAALGSPAYSAPEQLRGEVLDGRADVFSLALSLLEAWTRQPLQALTVEEWMRARTRHVDPRIESARSLPSSLRRVLADATRPDRARRTPSMHDFAAALDRVLQQEEGAPRSRWRQTACLCLLVLPFLLPGSRQPTEAALATTRPLGSLPSLAEDPGLSWAFPPSQQWSAESVQTTQVAAAQRALDRGLFHSAPPRIVDVVFHLSASLPETIGRGDFACSLESYLQRVVVRSNSLLTHNCPDPVRLPDDQPSAPLQAVPIGIALHVAGIVDESDDSSWSATDWAVERAPFESLSRDREDALHIFLHHGATRILLGPEWTSTDGRIGRWGHIEGWWHRYHDADSTAEALDAVFWAAQHLVHVGLNALGLPHACREGLADLPLHPVTAAQRFPFRNMLHPSIPCYSLTPTQVLLLHDLLDDRAASILHRGPLDTPMVCLTFSDPHDGLDLWIHRLHFSARNSLGVDEAGMSLSVRHGETGPWQPLETPPAFTMEARHLGGFLVSQGIEKAPGLWQLRLEHPRSPVPSVRSFRYP